MNVYRKGAFRFLIVFIVAGSVMSCNGDRGGSAHIEAPYFFLTKLSELQASQVELDFFVGKTLVGIEEGDILPVNVTKNIENYSRTITIYDMVDDETYVYLLRWKLRGFSIAERFNFIRFDSINGELQELPSLLSIGDYCLPDEDMDGFPNLQEFSCQSDNFSNIDFCDADAVEKNCQICPAPLDACDLNGQ